MSLLFFIVVEKRGGCQDSRTQGQVTALIGSSGGGKSTASLDGENESAVQAALSQLLRGKTVLVIALRMRTVAGADQIVVLEEGRVAQKGPPQELMEQGGLYRHMVELLLTGVDGNLGSQAAEYLLELEPAENLIFCGYSEEALKKFAERGVETRVTNFNFSEGLKEAFTGAVRLALISMPFVGAKRQNAHKNVVDAAKAAGVKQVIYTSLVNAGDETNPSVEKKDHIYTENYIKASGLDYIFLRNSQYAEAMITNYFTYVKLDGVLKNNQGDGKMAYISRKDCAKAVAYALHRGAGYDHATLNINGPELMTISQFIEYGNQGTGNHITYQEITDEENYQVFDAMGVPRTTDGHFEKGSEAPYSSDGMVTFGQAIREGKMDVWTDDFQKLTGQQPLTVLYMFQHSSDFQVGERHSKDN